MFAYTAPPHSPFVSEFLSPLLMLTCHRSLCTPCRRASTFYVSHNSIASAFFRRSSPVMLLHEALSPHLQSDLFYMSAVVSARLTSAVLAGPDMSVRSLICQRPLSTPLCRPLLSSLVLLADQLVISLASLLLRLLAPPMVYTALQAPPTSSRPRFHRFFS
jgi:hypothetical protein